MGEVSYDGSFPMSRFWAVFSTQSISLLGSQIVQFSLVWWLTESSGSASVLAFASIMALLPQVFFSPVAGALVDRWNRRLIMMATDTVITMMVVILAALYALGLVQVWHIYALMFIRGVGGAFQFPAMQASTTLMVERENLARVAGLSQALQGLVSILAPAAGALLYDAWPLQFVLLVDVVTAATAVSTLLFIRIPQPSAAPGKTSLGADIRAGVSYMFHWRGGLYLMLGAVLVNLFFVPAISLTPILVRRFFGGQALEYASLESTLGVGMVVGGVLMGIWGGLRSKVVTAMLSLVVAGLGMAAVGVLPPWGFLGAVACFGLIGIVLPFLNGSIFALLQSIVPPEMQGRVLTITMSMSAAMAPIGLSFAGPVADALGAQIWFILGGGVAVFFGVVSFFVPSMREMERGSDSKTVEQAMPNATPVIDEK